MNQEFLNTKNHLVTCTNNSKVSTVKESFGCSFIDDEDNKYLNVNDISCVLGYMHGDFTKGLGEIALSKTLGHLSSFSFEKEKLISRLIDLTNNNFEKIFFAGSGGEVVDWSIKLARRATGKDTIISFNNSLHGRSFAGAFLSGVPLRKEGFGTGLSNVYFWDFPKGDKEFEENADDYKDVAGIIIEPLQALGGMIIPNQRYLKWLRKYCDNHNIILIFDEIQTGFGKTGSMFYYEQLGIVPDILLMGKGMSNGFGMGALLMNKKVSDKVKPQEMSGGSADNEFMCSVVNLVLDIFEKENILENVKARGKQLKEGLQKLIDKKIIVGEINGEGLFMSLEVANADKLVLRAKEKGVILGKKENRILFRPPLIIKEEEINQVIESLNRYKKSIDIKESEK